MRLEKSALGLGTFTVLVLWMAGGNGRAQQQTVPANKETVSAESQTPLPSPWILHKVDAEQSNYLPRYVEQIRREKEYRASPTADSYLQARATSASILGDVREAITMYDEAQGIGKQPAKPLETSPLLGYVSTDAETFLLKAADHNRVLMINEVHHQPQTRVLTTRLLRRLYDKGFRYLALETLNPPADVAQAQKLKYPTAQTGTYTNEPVFGDMVRQALEIGYTLVPYEFDGDERRNEDRMTRRNRREIEEARNLKERIFDKDPNAKVLVHAGYSHVSEKPQTLDGDNDTWVFMAIRFKEMTGIDPFTVDQQTMLSHSQPGAEPAVYRDAVGRGWVSDRPVVFVDKKGNTWMQPSSGINVDAQVFLPPVHFAQERPDWLARDLNRVAVPVPAALQTGNGLRLVQAFWEGEPGNAVPVDQVLLHPGQEVPPLLLPRRGKKRFWLRAWDESGKVTDPVPTRL